MVWSCKWVSPCAKRHLFTTQGIEQFLFTHFHRKKWLIEIWYHAPSVASEREKAWSGREEGMVERCDSSSAHAGRAVGIAVFFACVIMGVVFEVQICAFEHACMYINPPRCTILPAPLRISSAVLARSVSYSLCSFDQRVRELVARATVSKANGAEDCCHVGWFGLLEEVPDRLLHRRGRLSGGCERSCMTSR